MPCRTLRVHIDAERQPLRYHAERGNDQMPRGGKAHCTALDSAEGVGGRLADDLPGTGSKSGGLGLPDPAGCLSLLLLRSRSSASRTPTPCGQKRLRGHATDPIVTTLQRPDRSHAPAWECLAGRSASTLTQSVNRCVTTRSVGTITYALALSSLEIHAVPATGAQQPQNPSCLGNRCDSSSSSFCSRLSSSARASSM